MTRVVIKIRRKDSFSIHTCNGIHGSHDVSLLKCTGWFPVGVDTFVAGRHLVSRYLRWTYGRRLLFRQRFQLTATIALVVSLIGSSINCQQFPLLLQLFGFFIGFVRLQPRLDLLPPFPGNSFLISVREQKALALKQNSHSEVETTPL